MFLSPTSGLAGNDSRMCFSASPQAMGPATGKARHDNEAGPSGRPPVRALRSQVAAELRLTLRRGDSVLLNVAIPVGLLVFFSLVDVLPKPAGVTRPVDFLPPGIMALAVMSTSM